MNTPSNRIGWIVSPVFFRDRAGFALAFALAMICAPFDIASAAEVSGVRVDPRARVAGVELALNGAGLRRLFLANVYVIGLYMPERTNSADTAIEATGPKRIALTLLRMHFPLSCCRCAPPKPATSWRLTTFREPVHRS